MARNPSRSVSYHPLQKIARCSRLNTNARELIRVKRLAALRLPFLTRRPSTSPATPYPMISVIASPQIIGGRECSRISGHSPVNANTQRPLIPATRKSAPPPHWMPRPHDLNISRSLPGGDGARSRWFSGVMATLRFCRQLAPISRDQRSLQLSDSDTSPWRSDPLIHCPRRQPLPMLSTPGFQNELVASPSNLSTAFHHRKMALSSWAETAT